MCHVANAESYGALNRERHSLFDAPLLCVFLAWVKRPFRAIDSVDDMGRSTTS